MQIFNHCSSKQVIPNSVQIDSSSILLLDIETTGLSPEMSTIFMIGCGYFKENRLHTIHWLADSLELQSEQDIFQAFSLWLCEHFGNPDQLQIITYNGQNFDLPFLKTRFEQCQISLPLCTSFHKAIDLYRQISALKPFWPVENLKLKTISAWLGYTYSKAPSGRSLIKAYHTYIKEKDPALLNLLFSHNIDDLEALTCTLSILSYFYFFNGSYEIVSVNDEEASKIVFLLHSKYRFPKDLKYTLDDFELNLHEYEALLHVPLYPQGLRYYYSDYKNYVYLPSEDYALHKTMAKYIDKSHWIKASPKTCYTWFLPDNSFYENQEKQTDYIQMIFRLFGFL